MSNTKRYSEEEVTTFLSLAQEIGITRAKRELGYPNSWATAKSWADLRGIEVAVDEIKAKASHAKEYYKDEEVREVIQEGFNRVYEELVTNSSLTADEQKKLAEAAKKYYDMWANLQGKANNITETRETDAFDASFQELLNIERAKNQAKKENVIES